MTAVTKQEPRQKRGLIATFADRQGMEATNVLPVLMDTIIPNGKASDEQVQVFLAVCNEYKLNPFLKEIYAFPAKGGGIQPIVSIDGWIKLIHEREDLDGVEFEEVSDENGEPEYTTCTIHRKGLSRPVVITEYFAECNRPTDPWKKWPRRMLRHKALIQCARVAFGFAGIVDEDEAERMKEVGAIVVETEMTEKAKSVHSKLPSRRNRQETEPEQEQEEPERTEAQSVEEEPQPEDEQENDAYGFLFDNYREYQAEIDECLKAVKLPTLDSIIPQDLSVAEKNKLARAARKFEEILEAEKAKEDKSND